VEMEKHLEPLSHSPIQHAPLLFSPNYVNPTNPPLPSHVDINLEPLSYSTLQNTPFTLSCNPNSSTTNPHSPSPTQYDIPTHFEDKASPQADGNVRALGLQDSRSIRQKKKPSWMKDYVM